MAPEASHFALNILSKAKAPLTVLSGEQDLWGCGRNRASYRFTARKQSARHSGAIIGQEVCLGAIRGGACCASRLIRAT